MKQELGNLKSYGELRTALAARDISVPPRTGSRQTHHTETYAAFHLLATLNEHNWLTFPFSVNGGETPDYDLRSGETAIGLEVTEAIATATASFLALCEREYPDAIRVCLGPDDLNPGSTSRDFRRIIDRDSSESSGWQGEEPEQRWAASVLGRCREKHGKLPWQRRNFDERWLLIYMNEDLPLIDIHRAADFCRSQIEQYLDPVSAFTFIFVEDGPSLVCFRSSGHVVVPISDLWSN